MGENGEGMRGIWKNVKGNRIMGWGKKSGKSLRERRDIYGELPGKGGNLEDQWGKKYN